MAKVKKITVSNLKAVSNLTADFNGCTAIIIGGNNKGKSSFLRSLPDRLRGNKPDLILKQGETNGFAEWILTTGEKLRWEFNNTTKAGEKLIYISEKEIKGALSRELCDRFFPPTFDVDKFLTDAPMKQRKTLQQLVGLDFTDIDKRYTEAYAEREGLNRKANEEKIRFSGLTAVPKIEPVSLDSLMLEKAAIRNKLNAEYLENKKKNEDARKAYEDEKLTYKYNVDEWQKFQNEKEDKILACNEALQILYKHGYSGNDVGTFPEKLAADHIKSWSNEGDLVYDPFAGSGTTLKMAHLLKRNWIGSEISSEYVELANKRLAPYLQQLQMF